VFDKLPIEMLEIILIRAYMLIFLSRAHMPLWNKKAQSFVILSSVSSDWWQTLVGWPQPDPESRAGRWVRHQIQRMLRGKTVSLHTLLPG